MLLPSQGRKEIGIRGGVRLFSGNSVSGSHYRKRKQPDQMKVVERGEMFGKRSPYGECQRKWATKNLDQIMAQKGCAVGLWTRKPEARKSEQSHCPFAA